MLQPVNALRMQLYAFVCPVSYRLDLARVNANDPDTCGDELLSEAFCEAADSGLGSAVDGATDIRLTSCNPMLVTSYETSGIQHKGLR